MTRDETIWLAGLLEGEGCFWTYRTRYTTSKGELKEKEYPAINVVMVDRDVIERVAALFAQFSKKGKCSIFEQRFKKKEHRTAYGVTVTGWTAADIMQAVLPWMGERRTAKINELLSAYEGRYRKGGDVCKRGHEFTPENTLHDNSGSRFCRTCAVEYPSNDAGDRRRLRMVV